MTTTAALRAIAFTLVAGCDTAPRPAPEVAPVEASASSGGATTAPAPDPTVLSPVAPAPVVPAPAPASNLRAASVASGGEPAGVMQGLVAAHNRHRADHCAAPLTWSPEVAAVAQRHADHLRASGCNLVHSNGPYGENLFWTSPSGSAAAGRVVDDWYNEVRAYNFARPGFSMSTGHFTQVVWKGTARLGCGVAVCQDAEIWVCNYDPPGNMQGAFPDNVAPTGCR